MSREELERLIEALPGASEATYILMNPATKRVLQLIAALEEAKSPRGGYTRSALAKFGVSWPPPKGWKTKLLEKAGRDE